MQGVEMHEVLNLYDDYDMQWDEELATGGELRVEAEGRLFEKGSPCRKNVVYECKNENLRIIGEDAKKKKKKKKKQERGKETPTSLATRWKEGAAVFKEQNEHCNRAFTYRNDTGLLITKPCHSKFTESFEKEIVLTGVLYENYGFSSKPFDVTAIAPMTMRTLDLAVTLYEHDDRAEDPLSYAPQPGKCVIV